MVVDGQEERVDPAQGGDVGFDDGDDGRGGVGREDGRRREEVGVDGDGWVCAGGMLLLLLSRCDGQRWCLRRRWERRSGFGDGWCLRWRGSVPWRWLLLEKGQNRRLLGARHVAIVKGATVGDAFLKYGTEAVSRKSRISHKEAMFLRYWCKEDVREDATLCIWNSDRDGNANGNSRIGLSDVSKVSNWRQGGYRGGNNAAMAVPVTFWAWLQGPSAYI